MNLIEFSIACKLISAKLRGVPEVPKVIPPTLLASLQHIGTPIRTPTGAMSPTESYKQFLTQQPAAPVPMQVAPQVQPMIPPQAQIQPTMMMQNQVQPNVMMMNQGMTATSVAAPIQMMPQMIPQQMMPAAVAPMQIQPQIQQIIPQQIVQAIPQTQEIIYQPQQTVIPPPAIPQVQPVKVPLLEQLSSGSLLDNLAQVQPTVAPISALPAAPTPTPPQSGHASRSMSFSEKAPSIPESP
jgi:hypothetical protein